MSDYTELIAKVREMIATGAYEVRWGREYDPNFMRELADACEALQTERDALRGELNSFDLIGDIAIRKLKKQREELRAKVGELQAERDAYMKETQQFAEELAEERILHRETIERWKHANDTLGKMLEMLMAHDLGDAAEKARQE